jgi:hypothetical protein
MCPSIQRLFMTSSLQILVVGPGPARLRAPGPEPFDVTACPTLIQAALRLGQATPDALLLRCGSEAEVQALLDWPSLSRARVQPSGFFSKMLRPLK